MPCLNPRTLTPAPKVLSYIYPHVSFVPFVSYVLSTPRTLTHALKVLSIYVYYFTDVVLYCCYIIIILYYALSVCILNYCILLSLLYLITVLILHFTNVILSYYYYCTYCCTDNVENTVFETLLCPYIYYFILFHCYYTLLLY